MSKSAQIAKAYIYSKPFNGLPQKSNFKLVNENVNPLRDGEYLAEAIYLKIGPTSQIVTGQNKIGETYSGLQIAKIVESKSKSFSVGKYVLGDFGWRTLTVVNEKDQNNAQFKPLLLPELNNLPVSLGLGALGIPGLIAYFGLMEICKPKENDVVVVSAAAGSVGHHVGQIAKIKKCIVIGLTSSKEKGNWLTSELGFDYYINYKTDSLTKKLQEYAPNGVDCYFDNVGGEISSSVIYQMNKFGRICVCGATSLYYNEKLPACEVQTPIKIKHVKMEGVHVGRWFDSWLDGIKQNLQWINEGKVKHKESVTLGFENTVEAFLNTLEGKNMGTAIVKL